MGAPVLVTLSGEIDPLDIANKELKVSTASSIHQQLLSIVLCLCRKEKYHLWSADTYPTEAKKTGMCTN